jgi:MFS transporter, SP family, solute carrier family 2 (myo-inositol transporter), member 13
MNGDEIELQDMRDVDDNTDANAPLISGREDGNDQTEGEDAPTQYCEARISIRQAGREVWLVTLSAGISGLLFGYDTGVISATLVSIGTDLGEKHLTTWDKSCITAITALCALLTSPETGYLADKYGRRAVILSGNLFFIAGAIVQAVSDNVGVMITGRSLVGAAIGYASCATPLYITEMSPAQMRGRLVTIQSLFITGGQVLAYLIGWALSHTGSGWRWMVGLGAVPAVLQLFLLTRMPETPRWLLKSGKEERARDVLAKIYKGLPEDVRQKTVNSVLTSIQTEIDKEESVAGGLDDQRTRSKSSPTSFTYTIKRLLYIPGNRRALTIACMLQGLQQLCGFNSLMYFSATIFAMVGFNSPISASLSIALTNFLFTVLAFNYIDMVGRRKILLRSIPFMIVGLVVCGTAFLFVYSSPVDSDHTDVYYFNGNPWSPLLMLSMILYVAAYAIGLGCVPWQQSELFPLQVRSLGSGLATATNWSSNFVIGISFLPLMSAIGPTSTFFIYAVICAIGWVGVFKIYPETAGLELEGIGTLLKSGWGVKESIEGFRARQQAAKWKDGEEAEMDANR